MAERRWQPSDAELELALVGLGPELAFPPTPDLAPRVRARLLASPGGSWWTGLLGRRLALVALLVVALAAGLLALWPEGRDAVARRLGLPGVTIEHAPLPPAPVPPPTASPSPSPAAARTPPAASPSPAPTVSAGARLALGERLTLDEARRRAPFGVLGPERPELGSPDEVYFGEPPLGGQVSFVWYPRAGLPAASGSGVGLLLSQFRGELDPRFYGKLIGPGTRLEELEVDGQRGLWIEGRPHLFLYRNRAGQVADEAVRLAGNVLLWERGTLTLRLESGLEKAEALAIARSVR
jgi:hypothetical protein